MMTTIESISIDGIEIALKAGGMHVERTECGLIGRQDLVVVHIDIEHPAQNEGDEAIAGVFAIRTELPEPLLALFDKPGAVAAINRFATLGALQVEDGKAILGSRITIYEREDAWNIQAPLILGTALSAPHIVLDTVHRLLTGTGKEVDRDSAWGGDDFDQVHGYLSHMSVCNADPTGLTAEFGLRQGSLSAITGDHHTALWRMFADQPHPDAGGGLLCCLEMPHRAGDESTLDAALGKLNAMEMSPIDLPPHFGAWCHGTLGDNPAYVSFLPNFLHDIPGIAVNCSFWAINRAQWADAMLPTLGLKA